MAFDWKALVRTIAPTVAIALGGPLAGVATNAISQIVLGKSGGTETEISTALAIASPETLVKLKELEQTFTLRMQELGIDIQRITKEDRESARQREVVVKDKTPRNLAYLYTIGFFGVLAVEFYIAVQNIILPEAALRTLDVTLGVLFAMMLGVKEYFFGSSAGSDEKTKLMGRLLENGNSLRN